MISETKTCILPLEDYTAYLEQNWRGGYVTNSGTLCRGLAGGVASFLGVSNLELVANGTLALQLAIKALGLQGEIITTPYSYVATSNAILWGGCDPVFVDIEDRTFCINPDLIEAAITVKTSAILATHVYGYPCHVAKIQQIADKHQLKVIYDAAHAFGVKFLGKSLSVHGDCSTLSFHATKVFLSAEGGAVVRKHPGGARRIPLMKKFGHIGEDDYLDIGVNAKLPELHAAMGLCVLPNVGEIIVSRKECSGWYDQQLEGGSLRRPVPPPEFDCNYAYYPVPFPSHEMIMRARQALWDNGIGPRRYFHPSLNTLLFLKPALKRACPVSEDAASRVLGLPVYMGLKKRNVEVVCSTVQHSMARGKPVRYTHPNQNCSSVAP